MRKRIVLTVLLLLVTLTIVLYFSSTSKLSRGVDMSVQQLADELVTFSFDLSPSYDSVIGVLQCENNICLSGEPSPSGGRLWPLVSASTVITNPNASQKLFKSALNVINNTADNLMSILQTPGANPSSNFFTLYDAYFASIKVGHPREELIQPFITNAYVETYRIKIEDSLDSMRKRSIMVMSQFSRQFSQYRALVSDKAHLQKLSANSSDSRSILENYDLNLGNATLAIEKIQPIFKSEMYNGDLLRFDNPEFCWAYMGFAIPILESNVRSQTGELVGLNEVKFIARKIFDDSQRKILFKSAFNLQTILPCIEVTSRIPEFNKQTMILINEIFDGLYDSPSRPLCDGSGGLLGEFTEGPGSANCVKNTKYQSDSNWLVEILSRFNSQEKIYFYKKSL